MRYIPRIAAVHDLCGYGKCSLGVAIPVLSAAGCDVCPVPTSLFSAHTKFETFYMHDTTEMLDEYIDAWNAEGISLDAIYSGFLGASEQVDCIKRLYSEHPGAIRFVDPVMGDAGEMYRTYTPELCEAMKALVEDADYLTPNLTEASILTGTKYLGQDISSIQVKNLIKLLSNMGAKNVVLKGIVHAGDEHIYNYIYDGSTIEEVRANKLPYMLHGTGDLFASCVLAAIMCKKSLLEAVEFASDFVIEAMKITPNQPDYQHRGVSFEPLLGNIAQLR